MMKNFQIYLKLKIWFVLIICAFYNQRASSIKFKASPCPGKFNYESTNSDDHWYGDITFPVTTTIEGSTIRIELDRPSQLLVTTAGPITSKENQIYFITHDNVVLERGSTYKLIFMVKFHKENEVPMLETIHFNGQRICPPDQATLALGGGNEFSSSRPDIKATAPTDVISDIDKKPRNPSKTTSQPTFNNNNNNNYNNNNGDNVQYYTENPNVNRVTTSRIPNSNNFGSSTNTGNQGNGAFNTGNSNNFGGNFGSGGSSNGNQGNSGYNPDNSNNFGGSSTSGFNNNNQGNSGFSSNNPNNFGNNGGNLGNNNGFNTGSSGTFGGGSDNFGSNGNTNQGNNGFNTGNSNTFGTNGNINQGNNGFNNFGGNSNSNQGNSGTNGYNNGGQGNINSNQGTSGTNGYNSGGQGNINSNQGTSSTNGFNSGDQGNINSNQGTSGNNGFNSGGQGNINSNQGGEIFNHGGGTNNGFTGRPNIGNEATVSGEVACGSVSIANPLITLAQNSEYGQWPWHVALFMKEEANPSKWSYICGGSLVSKNKVITAAHCVSLSGNRIANPNSLTAHMGKYNINTEEPTSQKRAISSFKINPEYNKANFHNDIAILSLKDDVEFTNHVRPICLWEASDGVQDVVGKNGMVVGWGYNEYQQLNSELKQATMPIVSTEKCARSDPQFFSEYVSDNAFCAGSLNGTGPCKGDSGGGLVLKRNNSWYLRGIVSVSAAPKNGSVCNNHHYIVFTDTAKYTDFIKRNL